MTSTSSDFPRLMVRVALAAHNRIVQRMLFIMALAVSAAFGYWITLVLNAQLAEGPDAALEASPLATVCGVFVMALVLSLLNLLWHTLMIRFLKYTLGRMGHPIPQ